LKEIFGELRLF